MDYKIAFWGLVWIVVGIWVAWKRGWYKYLDRNNDEGEAEIAVLCSIVFAPLNLFIAFWREFITRKW